jgi:hypothetical protein
MSWGALEWGSGHVAVLSGTSPRIRTRTRTHAQAQDTLSAQPVRHTTAYRCKRGTRWRGGQVRSGSLEEQQGIVLFVLKARFCRIVMIL